MTQRSRLPLAPGSTAKTGIWIRSCKSLAATEGAASPQSPGLPHSCPAISPAMHLPPASPAGTPPAPETPCHPQRDPPQGRALSPHTLCRSLSQPRGQTALTAALCPARVGTCTQGNNLLTHWECHHRVSHRGGMGRGIPHWDLLLFSHCSLPFSQGHRRRRRHPSARGGLAGSALRHTLYVQGQDKCVISDYRVLRDARALAWAARLREPRPPAMWDTASSQQRRGHHQLGCFCHREMEICRLQSHPNPNHCNK